VANLYFTVVAVLSCTEMSPVSPYTTIPPLVLVVGISVIKEGYEDYKRYKADKTVNQTKVLVWREGQWGEILWQELKVGELVQVRGAISRRLKWL
jgi:magnesium-transporting ATPase (P-type)